jgi:hypothetical protein
MIPENPVLSDRTDGEVSTMGIPEHGGLNLPLRCWACRKDVSGGERGKDWTNPEGWAVMCASCDATPRGAVEPRRWTIIGSLSNTEGVQWPSGVEGPWLGAGERVEVVEVRSSTDRGAVPTPEHLTRQLEVALDQRNDAHYEAAEARAERDALARELASLRTDTGAVSGALDEERYSVVKMISGTWNIRDEQTGAWVPEGVGLSKPDAQQLADQLNADASREEDA